MEHKLNRDEKKAISELERLAAEWPKSLWLFAGSGTLCVMKKNSDNERAMQHPGGGVDPAYIVKDIEGMPCDGGDW